MNNTSGHKGICWDNNNQRWLVECRVNGKRIQRSVNPSTLGISKDKALQIAIKQRQELELEMAY